MQTSYIWLKSNSLRAVLTLRKCQAQQNLIDSEAYPSDIILHRKQYVPHHFLWEVGGRHNYHIHCHLTCYC